MSPLWFTAIILALLAQVTLGVNPLDSILIATVEKVLQGMEARLAQQEEIFRQILVEQTAVIEAKTDALETRLVESTATIEARFAGQTSELETRLAQHNRGVESALDSLGESIQGQFSAFEERSTKNVAARLDDHMTNTNHTISALLLGIKDTVINEGKKTETTPACLPSDHVQHANCTLGALIHDIEELLTKSKNTTNLAESHIEEHLDGINLTLGAIIHDMEERLVVETRNVANTTEIRLKDNLGQITVKFGALVNAMEGRMVVETRNLANNSESRLNLTIGAKMNDMEEKIRHEIRTASHTTEIQLKEVQTQTDVTAEVIQGVETTLTALCSSPASDPLLSAVYYSSNAQLHLLSLLESRDQVTFLRRVDGSANFYRVWAEYQSGFGGPSGEFWLGLETLHQLTTQRQCGLRVDMEDFSGERKWAAYRVFRVGSESENFVLTLSGYNAESTAGDSMTHHNGMKFTTSDRDNDQWDKNCAINNSKGGWWYNVCVHANPTGPYKPAGDRGQNGITWYHAYSDWRSFKSMSLKLVVN